MICVARQLVTLLTNPLVLVSIIVAAAAVCRWRGLPRFARWMWACAALVGYLSAIPLTSDALLGPLEHRYPPLRDDLPLPAVEYIVVLGSDYIPHDGIPVTAALDETGLVRIVEGIRLVRMVVGSGRLIVSGGAPPGRVPPALGYAKLARDLGVPDTSIVASSSPLDTGAEARAIARLLGTTPFILVTSAYHMPRAVWLMKRVGTHPIPAPTGQLVSEADRNFWRDFIPRATVLHNTECAVHEYLGLLALTLGLG